MAEKEASQRRIIEQQLIQIADLQKTIKKLKEKLMEGVRVLKAIMINCFTNSTFTGPLCGRYREPLGRT